MTLSKLATTIVAAAAVLLGGTSVAAADSPVLPMRTDEPLVYATPFSNAVIVSFRLYDNKTWCRLYVRKEVWEAAKANGGKVPKDMDIGELQCEEK